MRFFGQVIVFTYSALFNSISTFSLLLSLEPGLLGPKTIDDSNFHAIVAKCIQTKNCN